jgi:putative transposase
MNKRTAKRRDTSKRHKEMKCRVIETKIISNKLSSYQSEYLNRLFLEAKWLYNNILSTDDVFKFDTKSDIVKILNKDKTLEDREIKNLSSQMKQSVKEKITESIKGLSVRKKNGGKVGRLKFTSQYKSIRLNQYNFTYKLIANKFLKLQGMNGKIEIKGLEQIPNNSQITSANLIKKDNDYFLKITLFTNKEQKLFKHKAVGIDFGIKTHLQLSDGTKFNVTVPISKRIKRVQQSLSRKTKRSKNYEKTRVILRKEYYKNQCKKDDQRKKIVSFITNNYQTICVQDEMISNWHRGLFGKQLQQSCLGGIMVDLKNKSNTLKLIPTSFASTQTCPQCNNKTKHSLDQRIYVCSHCGYSCDRDIHAANNILLYGLNMVGTERIDPKTEEPFVQKTPLFSKPVEMKTTRIYSLDSKYSSVNQETRLSS